MQRKQPAERHYAEAFYSLPGKLFFFLRAFYDSPFPPFSFAFNRNIRLAKPPASAPMGAAEDMFKPIKNAIIIANPAPIAAEAATTAANAATMMSRGPIFMALTSFQEVLHS